MPASGREGKTSATTRDMHELLVKIGWGGVRYRWESKLHLCVEHWSVIYEVADHWLSKECKYALEGVMSSMGQAG